MSEPSAENQLINGVKWAVHRKLLSGRSGNMSTCEGSVVTITPTGMVADLVYHGQPMASYLRSQQPELDADPKPSSEWMMHSVLYNRTGAKWVLHTHTPEVVLRSCTRVHVPMFHYEIALFGAEILPCSDYATFGSSELATEVRSCMEKWNTTACLIANHGFICYGDSLESVLDQAVTAEEQCRIANRAQSYPPVLIKDPNVAKKFQSYASRNDT